MGARVSCFGGDCRAPKTSDVAKPGSLGESTFSLSDLPLRYVYNTDPSNISENSKCGKGTFGVVHASTEVSELSQSVSRTVATKRSFKDKENDGLRNERNILCNLDHPHIVRLYGFTTACPPAQIMEMCDIELFALIHSSGPLSDSDSQMYFRQILMAMNYLHSVLRIVHRDIKPENVLITGDRKCAKVCDFGTAVKLGTARGSRAQGRIGSLSYAAPEVYQSSSSDFSSDIWSCGVLLYVMLVAASPFRSSDDSNPERAAVERVKKANLNTKRPKWREMSSEPKKLILRLLQVDPSLRPTAAQALQDKWLIRTPESDILHNVARSILPALEEFSRIHDPEIQSCWLGLASQMSDWDYAIETFEILDTDSDGVLGFADLTLLDFPETVCKYTFTFSEFVAALLAHLDQTQRKDMLTSVAPFAYAACSCELPTIDSFESFKRLIFGLSIHSST
jgi:serine/threonine protein kinase